MEWVKPEGITAISVMRLARTSLADRLVVRLAVVCGSAVPKERHREMATAIRLGLQTGCRFLLHTRRNVSDETLWRGLFAIPCYCEPAIAQCMPLWTSHQQQAFRWAAAILAYSVRNAFEDLHAKYIPDELMPTLNRTVRNTIFELIVADPSLGWRLSRMPRAFLSLNAEQGHIARLPNPVG
ncbi:hypothetical protein [Caballeronia sp. M23-90]